MLMVLWEVCFCTFEPAAEVDAEPNVRPCQGESQQGGICHTDIVLS